jgi:hypothetical protein
LTSSLAAASSSPPPICHNIVKNTICIYPTSFAAILFRDMFYTKSLTAFLTRGKPHLILLQLRERSFISENKLSLYNNLKLYIRIFILPCPFILKSYELHQIVLSSFRIQPRFYHKLSGLFFYGALKFKKSRNTFKLPGHCLFVLEAFRAYKNIDIASCYSIIDIRTYIILLQCGPK